MRHLNSFNENFLSIDINKIKESAQKFYTTKECRMAMSEIDINLLNNAVKEVEKLKSKYKSIDSAIKKIINKSESKNEGLAGTIILTVFGLHAFIKLLVGIKNGWSIGRYIKGLFHTDDEEIKTIFRDLLITITFLIYLLSFIYQSNHWTFDRYQESKTKMYIGLGFKYDGIHNYLVIDDYNKIYNFKRTEFGKWDIKINNKLIGKCINYDANDILYDINNKPIAIGIPITNEKERANIDSNYIKIDLEKLLLNKVTASKKSMYEVSKRKNEIKKLNNEIDSINRKAFENIDITRKILNEKGIDYDNIEDSINNYKGGDMILAKGVIELKNLMSQNNNLGYLSTFTNFLIEGIKKSQDQSVNNMKAIINLYKKLVDIGNLSEKLRDNDGNIKKVIEFKTSESLDDSINRVLDWQKVNSFVRSFPPTQKRLIWENGYYTEELKSISQYLTSTIVSIASNNTTKNNFLLKISSIKDRESLISILSSISNKDPWDYKHWESKLNNSRNIIVTWKSESEKMIICSVFTFAAIRKVAYMTNWCIFRDKQYFHRYQSKGYQYILYDFSKDERDNKSVIGFTTTPSYHITDCNNKSDYRSNLPEQFTQISKDYIQMVRKEYVQITMKDMIKKLDSSLWSIVKNKIKNILSNRYISNFLDMYDDGTM